MGNLSLSKLYTRKLPHALITISESVDLSVKPLTLHFLIILRLNFTQEARVFFNYGCICA